VARLAFVFSMVWGCAHNEPLGPHPNRQEFCALVAPLDLTDLDNFETTVSAGDPDTWVEETVMVAPDEMADDLRILHEHVFPRGDRPARPRQPWSCAFRAGPMGQGQLRQATGETLLHRHSGSDPDGQTPSGLSRRGTGSESSARGRRVRLARRREPDSHWSWSPPRRWCWLSRRAATTRRCRAPQRSPGRDAVLDDSYTLVVGDVSVEPLGR
jgi:hypothetical protein